MYDIVHRYTVDIWYSPSNSNIALDVQSLNGHTIILCRNTWRFLDMHVEEQKSLKTSKQRKLSPSSENVDVASDALVSANT